MDGINPVVLYVAIDVDVRSGHFPTFADSLEFEYCVCEDVLTITACRLLDTGRLEFKCSSAYVELSAENSKCLCTSVNGNIYATKADLAKLEGNNSTLQA